MIHPLVCCMQNGMSREKKMRKTVTDNVKQFRKETAHTISVSHSAYSTRNENTMKILITTKGNSQPKLVWYENVVLSKLADRSETVTFLEMTCTLSNKLYTLLQLTKWPTAMLHHSHQILAVSIQPDVVFVFIAHLNFLGRYYYCWHRPDNYWAFSSHTCAYVSGLLSSIQFSKISSLQID